jgi:hypothetical protein
MKSEEKLTSTLCGVAGEYFVAAELSRRKYVASLTLRNTRGIDILASNSDATKSVGIHGNTPLPGRSQGYYASPGTGMDSVHLGMSV